MIIGREARRAMDRLYGEIASGKFFRDWVKHGSTVRSRREIAPDIPAPFVRGERDVLKSLGSRRPKR
jgi:hypothetical protein